MSLARAFEIMEVVSFKILDTQLFLSDDFYSYTDTVNVN